MKTEFGEAQVFAGCHLADRAVEKARKRGFKFFYFIHKVRAGNFRRDAVVFVPEGKTLEGKSYAK